jgi:hypothetical protein
MFVVLLVVVIRMCLAAFVVHTPPPTPAEPRPRPRPRSPTAAPAAVVTSNVFHVVLQPDGDVCVARERYLKGRVEDV